MSITRIEKNQPLSAGQYWRAQTDIPKYGIKANTVLLIQRLHWVDDALHSISVQPHPSVVDTWITVEEDDYTHQIKVDHFDFLLQEFSNLFEFEPDGKEIRAKELQAIQARLTEIQQEMVTGAPAHATASNPSRNLLTAGDLTYTENLATALTLTRENANNQLATIQQQQQFYEEKQQELADTIQQMTPYFKETFVAAQSALQDEMDFIERLMKGLETLDLFLLKGIEVITITEGQSAPTSDKLALFQQKLYMQEEMTLYIDVDDSFDYRDTKRFLKTLATEPELQKQIFGGRARAVVCMATRRHSRHYGDRWADWQENIANKEVFLLIRNGANIHQIYLSLESHLTASQLFPGYNQMGGFFHGIDGSEIPLEDVRYVKAREEHDDAALHYFRFLILLAGLDNQHQLFGPFYQEADRLRFMTIAFQQTYFDFISDVDGANMLPLPDAIPVKDFIKQKNAWCMKGSIVIGAWRYLMDKENTPTCYSRAWRSDHLLYAPASENQYLITTVDASDFQRFIRLPVEGETRAFEHRQFNARVNVESIIRDSINFLCLDDVTTKEIHFYLHDRKSRERFDDYFLVFKRAEKFLHKREEEEQPLIDWLKEKLAFSNDTISETQLRQALATWRIRYAIASLGNLDQEQQYQIFQYLQSIARLSLTQFSKDAVALTLDTRNRFFLYTTPATTSTLLFRSHALQKTEVWTMPGNEFDAKAPAKTAYLFKLSNEKVIFAAPELQDWVVHKPDPLLPIELEQAIVACEHYTREILGGLANHFTTEHCQSIEGLIRADWRKRKGKYIQNPLYVLPVGLQLKHGTTHGIGVADTAASLLTTYANDEQFKTWFIGRYRNSNAGAQQLKPRLRLVSFPWEAFTHTQLHHEYGLLCHDEESWNTWRDKAIKDKTIYLDPSFTALDLDTFFGIFPMKGSFDFELKPQRQLPDGRTQIATNKKGDDIAILPLDERSAIWLHVPNGTETITLQHLQRGQFRLVEKESEEGRSGTSIQGVKQEDALGMLEDAGYKFNVN